MFYVVLRDMILYLYKDEQALKKSNTLGSHNAIRIHHCLASKATDYSKKQHVIRLQTSDWAEYLFQTSNTKECQEWIDTINFVAASLSAPPLPGAVGSQRKFQRPLLPASYTRLNMVRHCDTICVGGANTCYHLVFLYFNCIITLLCVIVFKINKILGC